MRALGAVVRRKLKFNLAPSANNASAARFFAVNSYFYLTRKFATGSLIKFTSIQKNPISKVCSSKQTTFGKPAFIQEANLFFGKPIYNYTGRIVVEYVHEFELFFLNVFRITFRKAHNYKINFKPNFFGKVDFLTVKQHVQ